MFITWTSFKINVQSADTEAHKSLCRHPRDWAEV